MFWVKVGQTDMRTRLEPRSKAMAIPKGLDKTGMTMDRTAW